MIVVFVNKKGGKANANPPNETKHNQPISSH